ncbi:LOW QUALITY PROTEIN: keratocan-like [Lethenteron reissneri]|uniref:LOW QUALITY PROTEIN: keratocan-like n=1 Tax=Lethenteron reissneri TaxID=7753 RepID=UPI002AB64336|nr:LOW QUALITY PROTEIN: keratocan-like [Lethenteron reissneri]
MVAPLSALAVLLLLLLLAACGAVGVPVDKAGPRCDQEDTAIALPVPAAASNGSASTRVPPRAAPRVPPLCPVACYCPPDHPGAIYCDGRELHDVPRIPARIRFAYLQNNNIEALSECDLRDAGGLLGLNLDGNVLTSPALSQDMLRSLRHLSQLHLQRNQLTEVPLFPASLEDLRLGQNRIALVPKGAFARLSRLRMLDLSANRLQVLRDDAFAGLSALVQLNLAENRLRAMPPKPPSGLLYQLILRDNVIESIPDNYLGSFPRLAWLDLGKNALGTQRGGSGAGADAGRPSAGGNSSATVTARGSVSVRDDVGGGGGGGTICVSEGAGGNKNASDAGDAGKKVVVTGTEAGNSSLCAVNVASKADRGGASGERRIGIPERAFISRSLINLRLSANHLQHVPAFHSNLVQLHLDENDIEDVNTTALCRPEGRESPRLSYFRLDKNPIMESPQAPVTLGKLMHCFPYLQPML